MFYLAICRNDQGKIVYIAFNKRHNNPFDMAKQVYSDLPEEVKAVRITIYRNDKCIIDVAI